MAKIAYDITLDLSKVEQQLLDIRFNLVQLGAMTDLERLELRQKVQDLRKQLSEIENNVRQVPSGRVKILGEIAQNSPNYENTDVCRLARISALEAFNEACADNFA